MELDYESCLEYLEIIWAYLPYMVYSFVFLTLVPKSFCRIKAFADADYKANRDKYHKCYGAELCCHVRAAKPKARKVVTRVYPKRKVSTDVGDADRYESANVRRQVNPATIQTQTNVNQIAQMFESTSARKINRVTPTVVPETCRPTVITPAMLERAQRDDEEYVIKSAHLAQLLQDLENRENSKNKARENFNNYVNGEYLQQQQQPSEPSQSDWQSEPLVQLRTRNIPRALTFAGTSATPSTGSPGERSPISDSPPSSSESMVQTPLLRMNALNLNNSLENIFAAIAKSAEDQFASGHEKNNALLSPAVTCIDDILSERRLSRPLSAYSISDLLNEEQVGAANESSVYVPNLLCSL